MRDFEEWARLRRENAEFLAKWEPRRRPDQHSRPLFRERVKFSRDGFRNKRAIALIIRRREDHCLIGAITLDNIRRGPACAGSVGYWLGERHVGNGYMKEALCRLVSYAFVDLDISRIEAATLEENKPSRRLLENSGFRYEGVAQSYLQIDGRWRPHVLYANLRRDRFGSTSSGAS